MALNKNKTGIMAAISAAAEAPAPATPRSHPSLPRGTVGSVRAGLGGIQEIDTAQVLGWGPQDRLALTAVNDTEPEADLQSLVQSIRDSGQQVPVLLRPSSERDGFFDVIYGRRRIQACQIIGIPVKALIRTLDDTQALIAKGLENAGRVELSFYERARFSKAILDQGYSRAETQQALAISKNTLSQLERVAKLIPVAVGDAIGAAPGAGRPKWMVVADAFETKRITQKAALAVLDNDTLHTSDMRFSALLEAVTKRGARTGSSVERSPVPGTSIKSAKSALTLSIKRAGASKDFAEWLDIHLDRIIEESHQQFQSETADRDRQ